MKNFIPGMFCVFIFMLVVGTVSFAIIGSLNLIVQYNDSIGINMGQYLDKLGILGEHQLYKVEEVESGHIAGYFHFGSGSIEGQVGDSVRFCWQPKPGRYIYTTIPYDKLVIVPDNTKEVPTIEFVFYTKQLNLNLKNYFALDENNLDINPNVFIIEGNNYSQRLFMYAIVRISNADLANEKFIQPTD